MILRPVIAGVTDHGELNGLADDDHSQYHNDARGDARYFREDEHVATSAGAGDAAKPIVLDGGGQIDASMLNDSDVDHGALAGLTDDDHVDYLRLDTARGLSQSVKLYVAANAYFIQEGNSVVFYVNDQEETRWP